MGLLEDINPFTKSIEKSLIEEHKYIEFYDYVLNHMKFRVDEIFRKETDPEIKALGKYTKNIFMDLL